MRDDDVRSSCFASLDVLCARFGEELPYPGGLAAGFAFRGQRVPFLSTQKGIFRAAAQSGPAALSIQTSWKSPYGDAEVETGYLYAYRDGAIDQHDNHALRSVFALQVPIIHFVSTRPNFYKPIYPCFVVEDDPVQRRVLVSPGKMVGPIDEREPVIVEDPVEREYVFRETRVRVHQARFRAQVVPAYGERCAICRLKESRLLDAAHILGDLEERGEPVVSNALSLCSIHHRAFDHDLVGITPDYEVRVADRLLEEDDGPMLELLKGSIASRSSSHNEQRGDPISNDSNCDTPALSARAKKRSGPDRGATDTRASRHFLSKVERRCQGAPLRSAS